MQARRVRLPRHDDARGSLCYVQEGVVPFPVRRAYYLYDVPQGASRGAHAHRALQQVLVAVAGSCRVTVDDGVGDAETFVLERPDEGLLVPPMHWRDIHGFAPGTVLLALVSDAYDEGDYLRDRSAFEAAVRGG